MNEVGYQPRTRPSRRTEMKISSLKENLEKGKRKTRRKMKEVNRMLVLNEKAWNFRMIKKVRKTA